jgi:hypothetical protein
MLSLVRIQTSELFAQGHVQLTTTREFSGVWAAANEAASSIMNLSSSIKGEVKKLNRNALWKTKIWSSWLSSFQITHGNSRNKGTSMQNHVTCFHCFLSVMLPVPDIYPFLLLRLQHAKFLVKYLASIWIFVLNFHCSGTMYFQYNWYRSSSGIVSHIITDPHSVEVSRTEI